MIQLDSYIELACLKPVCFRCWLQSQQPAGSHPGVEHQGWLAAKQWLCPQGKCQGQPWGRLVKDHISPSLCFQQPSILQTQDSQWTKINCFSATCAYIKPTFPSPGGVKRCHSIFLSVEMSFNRVNQAELERKDDQMEVMFVFNF